MYYFPIFVAGIGILCLFYFHFISIFCRCECCQVALKVGKYEKLTDEKIDAIEKQRFRYVVLFWIFLCVAVVIDHGFWFANEFLSGGLDKNYDTMQFGRRFLANLTDASDAIYMDSIRISALFDDSQLTCAAMAGGTGASLSTSMASIATTIDDFSSVLDDGPPLITDIENLITDYDGQKTWLIFVLYALILGVLVFYVISATLRSKIVMFVNTSTSGAFVLAALILCCVEMILLVCYL